MFRICLNESGYREIPDLAEGRPTTSEEFGRLDTSVAP